jgi:hypothetical protein
MKQALISFVKSKTFKALLAVVATALGAYASQGCGVFSAAKTPALEAFECRAAVLAPYVADAAPSIVAAVSAGNVNPVQLLLSLGLRPAEIVEVAKRYHECEPPAEAPQAPADAGVIGA